MSPETLTSLKLKHQECLEVIKDINYFQNCLIKYKGYDDEYIYKTKKVIKRLEDIIHRLHADIKILTQGEITPVAIAENYSKPENY